MSKNINVDLIAYTPNPLDVIYTAMRCCYYPGTPNDMYKNRDNYSYEDKLALVKRVINAKHHCYDKETEVLTSTGFKYWQDVTKDDKLAVFDPKTGSLTGYEIPEQLIKEKYNGDMYYFHSDKVDLMVTPNHRLYCSLSSSVNKRVNPEFSFYRCNDIIKTKEDLIGKEAATKPLRFKCVAETSLQGKYNPLNLDDSLLEPFSEFVGFFIGDGYSSDNGDIIRFHLKKERKINYLKDLCQKLNFQFLERANSVFVIKYPKLGSFCTNTLYNGKEKFIPYEYLTCQTSIINALIKGMINSDGSIGQNNSIKYYSTSPQVANMYQILRTLTGNKTTLKVKKETMGNPKWNPCFILCGNNNPRIAYPHFNDARKPENRVKKIPYDDYVYCATVSTGLLMVRRGKERKQIMLSGNSTIEHVSLTFAIAGIDRNTSHQLVRKRIASYSQQSLRYTNIAKNENLDELYAYISGNKPDEEGIAIAEKYYTDVTKDNYMYYLTSLMRYIEAVNKGVKKENARNYLCSNIRTNIVMTVNLRSFLDLLGHRCCTRAQLPIRILANKMAEAVRETGEFAFINKFLGPKCEQMGYCDEGDMCCGRKKTLEDIFE